MHSVTYNIGLRKTEFQKRLSIKSQIFFYSHVLKGLNTLAIATVWSEPSDYVGEGGQGGDSGNQFICSTQRGEEPNL